MQVCGYSVQLPPAKPYEIRLIKIKSGRGYNNHTYGATRERINKIKIKFSTEK